MDLSNVVKLAYLLQFCVSDTEQQHAVLYVGVLPVP